MNIGTTVLLHSVQQKSDTCTSLSLIEANAAPIPVKMVQRAMS